MTHTVAQERSRPKRAEQPSKRRPYRSSRRCSADPERRYGLKAARIQQQASIT
jgi:hypothetical protein